jgi:hypothetical protein
MKPWNPPTSLARSRVLLVLAVAGALLAPGCGPKKAPENAETNPTADAEDGGAAEATGTDKPAPGEGDAKTAGGKKDDCTGFEFENLDEPLNKSACEVPNTTEPGKEMKDKLEVKLTPIPPRVAPGGKLELIVAFVNKSKEPLPLSFRIDPTPRFEIEVSDAKNKRVDQPPGKPPAVKKQPSRPPEADPKTARITLAPNGTAKMKLPWSASKMRWAPEKLAGSLDRSFPRAPGAPLPKGKYNLRVITPLIGVYEGVDKEVSAPKAQVDVGG